MLISMETLVAKVQWSDFAISTLRTSLAAPALRLDFMHENGWAKVKKEETRSGSLLLVGYMFVLKGPLNILRVRFYPVVSLSGNSSRASRRDGENALTEGCRRVYLYF